MLQQFKCNTNKDVIASNHSTPCDGVFRDEFGMWLSGFDRNLGSFSVLVLELWGICYVRQLVWDKGYKTLSLNLIYFVGYS